MQPPGSPTNFFAKHNFLRPWSKLLHWWQQTRIHVLHPSQLTLFIDLLPSLVLGNEGLHPSLNPVPPMPPPSKGQLKARRRMSKMRALQKLIAHPRKLMMTVSFRFYGWFLGTGVKALDMWVGMASSHMF